MCAKYFHGKMALATKVLFLGLPVYNIVDRKIVPFPMVGGPLHLAPYFKREGMNQKSENMWSFQMTPSNLRNVIFMCAKYFHEEMALQRNVLFLGLPVFNSVDYVWDHISEGKACIKNPKTCGPSK